MRKLLLFVCSIIGAALFATPVISDLKVTPVEPIGLAIDYTVSGATENDSTRPLVVSFTTNNILNIAKTLVGATNCVNGAHRVYWNMAKDGITLGEADLDVTVEYAFPLYCVIDLSNGSSADSYSVSYLDAPPSSGFNTTEYKTAKLVLKRVDPGTFTMGDSNEGDNQPHTVTLTIAFYMGLYEVTQKQWELVTGENPSSFSGEAKPVEQVSYNMIRGSSEGANWPATNSVDATSFLGKLRERTELDFDLPTEAQWEYTCRAGTTTTYSHDDSENGDYMWYWDNSSDGSKEVGTRKANPWGFYDMHGNVWEWCLDWYASLSGGKDPVGSFSGSRRVDRGGYWGNAASICTSSDRDGKEPSYSYSSSGFRLSRTLPYSAEQSERDVLAPTMISARGFYADGSSVDGAVTLGYAPTEKQNAVVKINDEVVLNSGAAESFAWYAPTAGTYKVLHTVGDDELSATYVVTNGYVKIEDEANPPMDLVEGITISPMEISAVAKGGRSLITISGNGEAWTGATSADWLTLGSTKGTAEGKNVMCTIAANDDGAAESRVGYIYLAGQVVTVKQAGRGATVDTQVATDSAGGEVSVAVSVTEETTTWDAWSGCSWISVLTQSGTGSGEVKLQVAPWNRFESRTGTVTIAGQIVTVTQAAVKIEVEGGLTRTCSAEGADLVITVRVDVAGAPWKIDISEEAKDVWVYLQEGDEEHVGSDTFKLVVWESLNAEELPREATVTIGTQVLTIRQVAEIPDPVPEVTSAADLSAALEGSKDGRLAKYLTDLEKYAKYRAWVDKVAGTGADHFGTRQAVKDSELAWFAYALDLSALPENAPTNVVIETIGSAAEGGWDLDVSIGDDLKVGSDADAADLGTVFSVEGAADLTEESFSADNVTTTFSATGDGKLKVEVEPKSSAGQFFFRMKMTP